MSLLTDAEIRNLMLQHGFTVKEGQTDLKGYVFDAARAIEAATAAKYAERIAELQAKLDAAAVDAERWNWLNWHIEAAWGEKGFTSLVRIVSEKHRAIINAQVDRMMSGDWSDSGGMSTGEPKV